MRTFQPASYPISVRLLGALSLTLSLASPAVHAAGRDAPPAAAAAASGPALGFSASNMDRRVSPRRDFYRYAAGGWLDRTEIPPSDPDVGGFSQLADNLDRRLMTLIREAAASSAPAGSPRQQIGDYWRSAMDLDRVDAIGIRPLEADLQRVDAVTQSAPTPADLGALSSRLQLGYAASPLLNLSVDQDFKDSSRNVLVLGPGAQSLEVDEYLKPEGQRIRDLYRDHIAAMFAAAGDTPQAASAAAATVLDVETELVRPRLSPVDLRDPSRIYNMMSLDEAQKHVPAVDLRAALAALDVKAPERVQVVDIGGLQGLQAVLSARKPAELRTLLRWHLLAARADQLARPWRDLDAEFKRQRAGLQTAPERSREVARAIGVQLFHPLSQLYVQAHFPDATRREITRMVAHVREAFEARLRANPWLDGPTRAAALDKLARIDIQVGYPANWIDFSSVAIKPDDYFGNVQRLAEFQQRRTLARLNQPPSADRFADPGKTTPISVNAAYNPLTNSIDITAAIVQPPFYVPGADAAVNYCTIGAVIGHELTHGFDSMGRQFGPAGNLRDWWTPTAAAEFEKRTAVLVEQYSSFTLLPGLKHNGLLTVTENTADLGGISLAYDALHREVDGKPQPRIDGLSTDQRCFVAWAQMWAYKARPERTRLLASVDYHANSSLRGFAPLQHLEAFHRAFGIRQGDAMWRAPAVRARIW